jgi:hypothetical protein
MRNISRPVLSFLFLLITSSLFSQTVKNIFDGSTPLTYLGIDFTQARVFGETSTDATKMRDQLFPAINSTVNTQTNRYDIQEALHRTGNITRDLSYVTLRNKSIPVQQIKSSAVSDYTHLKSTDIDKLVQSYMLTGKSGIGLLFVVDGMSKLQKAATIHVVFINMITKKVLLSERLEGEAGGFGFTNYWVKPFEKILDQINSSKYEEWKKKYVQ